MDINQNVETIVVLGPFVDAVSAISTSLASIADADAAVLMKHNSSVEQNIASFAWSHASIASGTCFLTLRASVVDTLGNLSVTIEDESLHLPYTHHFKVLSSLTYNQKYGTDSAASAAIVGYKLDHLVFAAESDDPADNSIIAKLAASAGDWSDFAEGTDSLEALRNHVGDGTNLTEAGGTGDQFTATLNANIVSISGDSTAADNLELQYDGTGYNDPTAPSSRSQVDGIGAGTGAALNFANEADNVDSAIKSISFDGVETSGTNASVNTEDGTWHQIDDTANNIDIVYQFDIGGGRTATEVSWKGRLVGTNDTLTFQAYNGTGWDTIKSISGQSNSAPSTTADNATEVIPLLSTHTGTGSDLGKVFIRLECASQSNPTIYTDLLLVSAVNVGQSVGYADGAVWIDTNLSNTNTESFVDGVADNPVSTIAAALTIATAVGLKRLRVASGSSITFAADMSNYAVVGQNYTIAFGGQTVTGSQIVGATVSGTYVGTTCILEDCIINAITGPGITMRRCFFNEVTMTANAAGSWFLNDCRSRVAGTGSPNFDFGATIGNVNLNLRGYSGGIELENMGDAGTDTASIEGDGQIILNANCDAGSLSYRGNFKFLDNSGNVDVLATSPVINVLHQGTAQAGGNNTITLDAGASATNGQYDPGIVTIVAGTGMGQSRLILEYDGTTKVAVVSKDWRTNPDSSSSFVITTAGAQLNVNEGLATGGAATTITLNSAASSTDDIYIGQTIFLVSGTGQDQSRVITDYNGTTKVATVHKAWNTNPDTTTGYIMLPLPSIGDTVINIEVDTQDIQGRLPSALVGGKMDSDMTAISGSTGAADQLEQNTLNSLAGTASGTPTTTTMVSDIAIAVDDQFKGRIIIFDDDTSTVALRNQATDITACTASSNTLTFRLLTTSPSSGDTFVIV